MYLEDGFYIIKLESITVQKMHVRTALPSLSFPLSLPLPLSHLRTAFKMAKCSA